MVKCPFCSFGNEDGALFCEQCKSDISSVAPMPAAPSAHAPTPMPESIPPAAVVEDVVMAAVIEEAPPVASAIPLAEEVPMAAVTVDESPAAVTADLAPAALVEPPPVAQAPVTPPPTEPVVAAPIAAVAVETPPAAAAAPTVPAAAAAGATPIPPGSTPKLVVQRGLKIGEEYALFAGENYIGRADEKPVDVDLTFQEPEDRVWTSRQHALIIWDDAAGMLTIEDLNSSNGTFVNRERVYPGQPRQLHAGNTVQIGTVHMRIKV